MYVIGLLITIVLKCLPVARQVHRFEGSSRCRGRQVRPSLPHGVLITAIICMYRIEEQFASLHGNPDMYVCHANAITPFVCHLLDCTN